MSQSVEHFEVAIIGAGPGGIGAATNAAHNKLSHILIEKQEIGNTVYNYQLRKHVMAEPGKLPLRCQAPFAPGSREAVLNGWQEAIKNHSVNLRKGEATAIKRTGDRFEIQVGQEKLTANKVILAIGCQGTPRKLGVPGEDLPTVSYTLSDPDAFKDKDILIVGAGDAAIENALALVDSNRVTILNRSADFPLAKDANVRAVLKAVEDGKLKCLYNSSVAQVAPGSASINTPEGEIKIKCDQIIARIGAIMPRKFLESCGISFPSTEMSAVPVVSSQYESNVPGLFIVGALIGYPLIKQAMNQGHEVIEHLMGRTLEPADQVLIEEKLVNFPGGVVNGYEKIKEALSLFSPLSEPQYRELIIDSIVHIKSANDTVFKHNDYTDSCYSIVTGECQIEIPDGPKIVIGPGEYFGELGLLSGRRRSATVRTTKETVLLETPRKMMLKLISAVQQVREAINRKFMLNALKASIFPDVEKKTIEELVASATLKNFKKGEVLFKEGDTADVMYVIRKGSLKVARRDRSGKDITQVYLPAGHYVGEMALLSDPPLPRSATVTAAVACETIVISKDALQKVLKNSPKAMARIAEVAESRRIENITTDWNSTSGNLLEFMLSQGLSDAENVLLIDSDLCIACDNCEAACAATHGGYSRLDRKGGKSFASIQIPISCRHCENPLCMVDCPPDALVRRANGEVIIQESCIGCGNCVRNCPYGVIQMVYDKPRQGFSLLAMLGFSKEENKDKGPAKAGKCDMCSRLGSGPACVRSCPTGAAMRVNPKVLVELVTEKQS